VTFPLLVFEIWCSQAFWDAYMHSLRDGQTRIQYASDDVFQRCWRLISAMANRQRYACNSAILMGLVTLRLYFRLKGYVLHHYLWTL